MSVSRFILLLVASLACILIINTAHADNLLEGVKWNLYQPVGDAATLETELSSPPILHLTLKQAVTPFYSVGLTAVIPNAISEGSRLKLRFEARSNTLNPVRAVVEKNGVPYTSVMDTSPTLSTDWKSFAIAATSSAFPAEGLTVKFQFGQQAGEIEIRNVILENLGPDPDLKAAEEAIKPAAIQARIEKYRKGKIHILVQDKKGNPVPGVSVHIEQTQHDFLFGCNIFNLDTNNSEPWQKEYRQRFTALFNYATVPFYWGAFEPQQGKLQYDRLDAMTDWSIKHGLTVKGHPLVWHEVYPRWAPNSPDEAIPLLHSRVTQIMGHYKGRIHYWDVLNEANNAPSAANGEGAWIKRDGAILVVQTALHWAREAGKGGDETLLYNDFNIGPANLALLNNLKQTGTLPDAIGIQSHMHGGVWTMSKLWQTASDFGKFGKPIHFTEVTVLSGPIRNNVNMANPPNDWLTTPADEAKQADYVEKFYTLLFSHPAMKAITWWDLSDRGAWQNSPAGLLRKDMSPKPAYKRLMQLIHEKWWTNTQGKTDQTGNFETRAYYGDYLVTINLPGGKTLKKSLKHAPGSNGTLKIIIN